MEHLLVEQAIWLSRTYCDEAHLGLLSTYGSFHSDEDDSRGVGDCGNGIEITSLFLTESAERIGDQPAKATISYNLSSCPQHNKIQHNLE